MAGNPAAGSRNKGNYNPNKYSMSQGLSKEEMQKLLSITGGGGGVSNGMYSPFSMAGQRKLFSDSVPYLNNILTPDALGLGIGRNLLGIGPGNNEKFPGLVGWMTGMYNKPEPGANTGQTLPDKSFNSLVWGDPNGLQSQQPAIDPTLGTAVMSQEDMNRYYEDLIGQSSGGLLGVGGFGGTV